MNIGADDQVTDAAGRPVTACCGALISARPFDCLCDWVAHRLELEAGELEPGSSLDPDDPDQVEMWP